MVLTPQIATIIAFAAGAVIFFGIGFFIANILLKADGRRLEAGPAFEPSTSRNSAITDPTTPAVEEITTERDQAMNKYLALKAYTTDQRTKTRAYFSAVKTRVAELRNQLQAANTVAGVSNEKAQMLARKLERSKLQNASLQKETAKASQALALAQKQLKAASERLAALSGLQEEHQALLQRVETSEGLQKEIEALRDESLWLKSQLAETNALKDEISELKRENASLNAMGVIPEKPLSHSVSPPLEGLGGSFQNISNQLSRLEGSRGVAMADELGLLIAGTGEHMEAMAGMAAVFSEVCLKTEAILPFGKIDAMTVSNRHNLTIAMQPFNIASVNVIITTLSVGKEPDRDTISHQIDQENVS